MAAAASDQNASRSRATPALILPQRTLMNEAARAETAAQVDKLKGSIPIIKQRVAAYKQLLDDGNGAKLQYPQNWQDEVEHEQDLEATRRTALPRRKARRKQRLKGRKRPAVRRSARRRRQ